MEINGGVTTLGQVEDHLKSVDAVMIGRAAYDNPYLFATVDRDLYDASSAVPSRQDVVFGMLPYIEEWLGKGAKLNSITRHMLQLFAGQPGTRAWKREITEGVKLGGGTEVVVRALEEMEKTVEAVAALG